MTLPVISILRGIGSALYKPGLSAADVSQRAQIGPRV